MKVLKKLIGPNWIVFSSITTIVTGMLTAILTIIQEKHPILAAVLMCIFFASLSLLLVEILIGINKNSELVESLSINQSGILLPEMAARAQSELVSLLNDLNSNIDSLLIICYGTSGYGEIIDNINYKKYAIQENTSNSIKLEVVVSSPNVVFGDKNNDKNRIEQLVNSINNNPDISVYYAKTPPTIRGCVVYDKKKQPIWSCLQTYCYGKEYSNSAYFQNSYTIVGRPENQYLLKNNNKIITKEFQRLKESSQNATSQ